MKKRALSILLTLCMVISLMPAMALPASATSSPDTFTQKSGTLLPSNAMCDVAYGNGVYVAVGYYGAIIRSTDAETWTNVKTNSDVSSYTGVDPESTSTYVFSGAAYGNGTFVVGGDYGVILTSPDGNTWKQQPSGLTTGIHDIRYLTFNGSSAFYALSTGCYLTSADGITWTKVTPVGMASDASPTEITVGENGTRLAIGMTDGAAGYYMGKIISTTDGTNWAASTLIHPDSSSAGNINMLTWMDDKYIISDLNAYIWTSTDLLTFTLMGAPFKQTASEYPNQMFHGIYDGSEYYLFGSQPPYGSGAVYTSTDAAAWTMQPFTHSFGAQNVEYLNGKYFQVGNEGILVSSDGQDWAFAWGGAFSDVTYDGTKYIAAGALGSDGAIWTSTDLQSWSNVALASHCPTFYAAAYGNGKYVAAGANNISTKLSLLTSSDGTSWTTQTADYDSVYDIAYGSETFVMVGTASSAPYLKISTDGTTWTTPTLPTTSATGIWSVAYVNNQFIAIGYNNTSNYIWTSPDGETWTDISSSYTGTGEGLLNIVYSGGKYVLLGYSTADSKLFTRTSSNLSSWSAPTALDGYYSGGYGAQLGVYGENLYALGSDASNNSCVYFSGDQGGSWSNTEMDVSGFYLSALSEANDQLLITGSSQLVMATEQAVKSPAVTVGTQSAALQYGKTNSATFSVNTANFTSALTTDQYTIHWFSDAAGETAMSAPVGVTLAKTDDTTLTASVGDSVKAGTYYFTLTAASGSETATSGVMPLTVDKTIVSIGGLAAADSTYTGSQQVGYTGTPTYTPGGFSETLACTYYLSDGITQTTAANSGAVSDGAAPVNTGSYKVVVSIPADNADYIGSTTVDFTIVKAPVSFTVTDNTYDYDTQAHAATVTQTVDQAPSVAGKFNVTYQKNTETPTEDETNVGVYKILVTLTDDNFKFDGQEDATRSLTLADNLNINGMAYTGAITWPTAGGLTYGQTLSQSVLSDGAGAGTFAWKNDTTVPTVVNTGYAVVFTPTDTNYSPVEHPIAVTVAKKELTISGVIATTRAYEPGNLAVALTGGALNGVVGSDDVTLDGSTASGSLALADAGTDKAVTVTGYTLSGAAADRYTLTQPAGITVIIAQAEGTASVSMNGWTYGGAAVSPVPTSITNGTEHITYTYKGRNGTTYPESGSVPTNAGDYTVTANFTATGNYKSATATADFTVAQKTVTAVWTSTTKTYTGEAQSPIVKMDSEVSNVTISSESQTDAGSYTMKATLSGIDANNYTLANATMKFVIQRAPVTFTVANNSVQANGSKREATVTATALNKTFASTNYTITYKNAKSETIAEPTDAGVYDIYAAIANPNYRHADGTDGMARKIGVLTIYQTAAPTTYTVKFDGGGATGGTAPADMAAVLAGTPRVLPANTFENTGNTFAGWKHNGSTYQPGESLPQPAANVTVTALWTANTGSASGTVKDSNSDPVPNATVTLMLGSQTIQQTTTNSSGEFSMADITPGIYNLVAARDDKIQTVFVEIKTTAVTSNIVLPANKTNSVVEVEAGSPVIVVGNLEQAFSDDDQTKAADGNTVEIKLTASAEATDVSSEVQTKILEKTGNVGIFLDLMLTKTTTPTAGAPVTDPIPESPVLLKFVIQLPGELQGKSSYTVYRYHDDEVQALTTTKNAKYEYIEVNEAKTEITVYAKYFSTYALTYTETTSSNSSSSGTSTYSITTQTEGNGAVTASSSTARAGTKVTVTVTPDSGYRLDTLSIKDAAGKTVAYTDNGTNSYTFTMPSGKVTVSASFTKNGTFPFTDVPENHWARSSIEWAYTNGVFAGTSDTTFGPEIGTTRGMIAVILWRMENRPAPFAANPFADVASGSYYENAIAWAVENEIVKGYGNGNYGPNDPITREQMAAILYRFAQYKKYDVSVGEDTNILSYNDAQTISEYAVPALQWACGAGLVQGSNQNLMPTAHATRAQAATMLQRFMQNAAG